MCFGGFGYQGVGPWMMGMGIFRGVIILAVTIGIIYLISKVIKNNNSTYHESGQAIAILKEKYANGEISDEEYQRKIKILK